MPTFDFKCQDCQSDFEANIRFGQDPKADCPSCESDNTQKQFTKPGGIIFKGSGFYKNDARGNAKSAEPAKAAGDKTEVRVENAKPNKDE